MGKVLSCSVEGYLQLECRRSWLVAEGSIGFKKKRQKYEREGKKNRLLSVLNQRGKVAQV